MAEDYQKFRALNAVIVAISVDWVDDSRYLSKTLNLPFDLLCDPAHKAIEDYGVFDPVDHGGIARPATFILDKNGVIRYMYVGKDPSDRPSDATLLEELKKIKD